MKPQPLFVVVTLTLSFFCLGWWTENRALAQVGTCAGDCNRDDRVTVDELVTGVNMALGTLPVDRCPDLDRGGDDNVTVDDLIAAVSNALGACGSHANRAPRASDVSFSADTATPYVQKQLIGSDPDNDTITYELVADDTGTGYSFAYVNPDSGILYLTLAPDFQGTIALQYRVTDGKLFSQPAHATLEVQTTPTSRKAGLQDVDPQTYASFPRGFYNGTVLGAPGSDPMLPSAVDLSDDYPLPGNQGQQNSCVGWSLGYAIKTYQERVEHGWSLEAPEHQFSASYIYNQLNNGRDNGVIYTDGLNLIVDQGVATLARMPYDDLDLLTQPSAAARQEAFRFRAKTWKAANGTLEVKAALANRLPVFMVIQLVDDIHGLRGPDSVYNTFGGAFEGGHGVAAVGYDDNRYGGAFKIINSWGQDFGDNGYFWMPYTATNYIIATPSGPTAVLTGAVVIEDLPDPDTPDPDPVDPPTPAELPDLQVTDWMASYDGRPGGSGSLQYTITNTGIATAPAGAYVALVLSRDPTFKSSNTLVVYESIPFAMAPGTTVYRDTNNSIAFYFPQDLEPGDYYMALWADIWDGVAESNESDNISPSTTLVEIVNTLPDVEVQSWYSRWDASGNGSLTYDIVNDGASSAPAGWLVSLVLSPNDTIGDGDEIFLFSEPANYGIDPGGILYRDESAPAAFSLVYDNSGNPVPAGVYYLALWLDPNQSLAESNKSNNASLSWGTVTITSAFDESSAAARRDARSSPEYDSLDAGDAYNGKMLPARDASVRKVHIRAAGPGARQMEFLDDGADTDSGPRVKTAETHTWSKLARARQQVVFPCREAKPMPSGN
jgi:Papain family cysteine protease/Bacterial Ig domain/CARDB